MGWLFGWSTKEALVEHLVRQDGGNCAVIDHSLRGNNLWMLCQRKDSGFKFIVLCKIACDRTSEALWGYKDIDESMGPCERDCPEKFLSQSDDTSGYSVEWRAKCREWRKRRRERLSAIAKLRDGDRFYVGDRALTFVEARHYYPHNPRRCKNYVIGKSANGEVRRYAKSRVRVEPAAASPTN